MTRPTFRRALRDVLTENAKGLDYYADLAGKPRLERTLLTTMKSPVKRGQRTVRADAGASEAQVLNSVLAYLRTHPGVAWCRRMNTGMALGAQGQPVRFGFVGCSDIIGQMQDGRFVGIECKREFGGTVSPEQQSFIDTVRKNNGIAGVVRSIEDAERLLREG